MLVSFFIDFEEWEIIFPSGFLWDLVGFLNLELSFF